MSDRIAGLKHAQRQSRRLSDLVSLPPCNEQGLGAIRRSERAIDAPDVRLDGPFRKSQLTTDNLQLRALRKQIENLLLTLGKFDPHRVGLAWHHLDLRAFA